MRRLTNEEQQDLNQGLFNAVLHAFWTQTHMLNEMGIHSAQSLGEVTCADSDADIEQLAAGFDLLISFGGDLLLSTFPLILTTAGLAYCYRHNKTTATNLSKLCLNATVAKGLSYATLKTFLTLVVLQGVTATNPLAHIGLALGFGVFYSLFSSGMQFYGEFKIKRSHALKAAQGNAETLASTDLGSFSRYFHAHKDRFASLVVTNFFVGITLYAMSFSGLDATASFFAQAATSGVAAGGSALLCRRLFTKRELTEDPAGVYFSDNDRRSSYPLGYPDSARRSLLDDAKPWV